MLPVDILAAAEDAAQECDLMLVVGTSGVVHPAAGLARTSGSMWAISGQRLIGDPEQRMLQSCLCEDGPFHFGKEGR